MEPICYRQDDKYFFRNGDYAGEARELFVKPDPQSTPLDSEAPERPVGSLDEKSNIGAPGRPAPLGRPSAAEEKHLRSQMNEYDEPWQGVSHARKYLGLV
jgi:hypothetical protein